MERPYHVKVTRTDGTVTEDDYSEDFEAMGCARQASDRADVASIEVSVTFVNGEAADLLKVAAAGRETRR